jgi:hypothetical protein
VKRHSARGLLWPILPGRASSEFLRACLLHGAEAAQAFELWCRHVGNPLAFLRGDANDRHRALLPLLERALRAQQPPSLDESLRTTLRTGAVHERARAENFERVFCDVAQVLDGAALDWVAVGGPALSHSVWPDFRLRHDAAIVAVIAADGIEDARSELEKSGCAPRGSDLRHPAGPAVRLRARVLEHPTVPGLRETTALQIGSVEARIPVLDLALLERCAHGLTAGCAEDLNWICDLWFLSTALDAAGWSRVLSRIQGSRGALAVWQVLARLREMGAPFPESVVRELQAAAERIPIAERDGALFSASRSGGVTARVWLSECDSWQDRARLVGYGVRRRWAAWQR